MRNKEDFVDNIFGIDFENPRRSRKRGGGEEEEDAAALSRGRIVSLFERRGVRVACLASCPPLNEK